MSPEAYESHDLRLVQERSNTSAADALFLQLPACPEHKIWSVIGIGYFPSVAETQVVSLHKVSRSGAYFGINNPTSFNLNPGIYGVDQAAPFQLFPGESIIVRRVAATGGSTMSLKMQFIETDLPLYDYVEPQEALRQKKFASSIRKVMSRTGGAGGGSGAGGGFGGGRGGGPPAR